MVKQLFVGTWVCRHCGVESEELHEACPQCGGFDDPFVGKTLKGTYRLQQKLAAGGMGAVYKAEHVQLHITRAVKVIHSQWLDNSEMRHRFLREVRVTHALSRQNDHIVHINDVFGFDDGVGFYAMEFLEGDTLKDRIARYYRSGMPMEEARELLLQICDGMQAVHEAGVIHRDLKPSNLFITQKRGQDFIKIVDFGIAKPLQDATQLTGTNDVVGTPAYMSPEQVAGASEPSIDARSDIYSLGAIAYEMFTGYPLFPGKTPLNLLAAHLAMAPPTPSEQNQFLPEALDTLVLKMLEKDPKKRQQSMQEVSQELKEIEFPQLSQSIAFALSETMVSETGQDEALCTSTNEFIEQTSDLMNSLASGEHKELALPETHPPFSPQLPKPETEAAPQPKGHGKLFFALGSLNLLFLAGIALYLFFPGR